MPGDQANCRYSTTTRYIGIWKKINMEAPTAISPTEDKGHLSLETYRLIGPGMVGSTGRCCKSFFDEFRLSRTQPRQASPTRPVSGEARAKRASISLVESM